MLSDRDIEGLIKLPKLIVSKTPADGYREENGFSRCTLELEGDPPASPEFTVFVRRSIKFIENFSIGLRYRTGDRAMGTITLARYNGPHGELSRQPDGHYAKPHIHRLTAAELASGSSEPQESARAITDRYVTYEQALDVFFRDTRVSNHLSYFPRPNFIQKSLLNGHQ